MPSLSRPPRQLVATASVSRSSVVVSVGLLFTSLLGASQGLLLVFIVGEGDKTDAFLAAYSLYLALTLFGASLRGSVVAVFGPVRSEEAFRRRAEDVVARIIVIGLALVVPFLLASPVLGLALTGGLSADARTTAIITLLVLAPAAFLQLHAAALSALLSSARRFHASTALYVVSGVVALSASAVLLAALGVLGMALGLLVGAVVLAGGHAAYVRRFGFRFRPRASWLAEHEQRRLALTLLAGAALGITFQVNLTLSLGAISGDRGAITLYSYAFFMVSLMLSMSSLPLGLVTLPEVVDRIEERGVDYAASHFESVTRFAFAVLMPLVAGYAAYGKPVLEAVFSSALAEASVDRLYTLGLVLSVMAIPMALLHLGGAVTLALARSRGLIAVSVAAVLIHALFVLPLSAVGTLAVAGGHVAAATVATLLLLRVAFQRRWLAVLARALWGALPAFLFSAVFLLGRLPLGPDPSLSGVALAASSAAFAYVALTAVFWRDVSTAFADLLGIRKRVAQ